MMKNPKYTLYAACLLLSGLLAGCKEEFLERPPLDQIVDANFYKTDQQVLAGTAPLYNIVWFAYNDKASHGLGDARGGVLTSGSYQLENVQFNTTGLTGENVNAWRSFYNIIGQANTVITNINQFAGPQVSPDIKQHALGEARFMRGVAYSYLVQNWGPVPIITDNSTLLQDTSISRNTVESVWELVIRDLRFATEALPPSPVQPGRVTQWSAEGMLAKMYLTRAGISGGRNQSDLDSAAYFAKRVIDNSGASLLPNYEDLFLTRNNNNPETLFALQWTYNHFNYTQYGVQNSVQAYLAYGSEITGFGDGWGGDIGASYDMIQKYGEGDKRRKATFMYPGDHYPYITQKSGNNPPQQLRVPVNTATVNGESVRGNTRAWVKKYVVGRPEDNNDQVVQQGTGIQTYMLRLADVYLIYAEAVLDKNPGEALKYYNAVHQRAGMPARTEALTFDELFAERQREFAMEGQLWYDFVRLHYYNPQKAYSMLSNQERGFYVIEPNLLRDPTDWKVTLTESRKYNVNSGNFILPIPSAELSRAPNLRKPPVPFDFTKLK
ncbi:MAG: Cell surface glycan-binding lipoprotein, utilization system for glycans and polysaccharides (PUL), SusD family [uncultured Cytophagales bacterium]|uniref:Cell surface glycan-binding lipoprotein, utilization system for glycans and polysaccharides (PUL), SusD family n=1 Tax=uncultured Cytophagales bacterium TaxID=158755 RepID=A0A6J4ISC9_9SPHI|nr:MAG: Cell surface glycan-binding lipoprotein, utilization system for glycans and polysaccharides (PUL), SusD family [uncultured Cytophagales bacterium]